MGNVIQFGICSIIISFFTCSGLLAQELNDKEIAIQNIKDLKEGALIIRLKTNAKKIVLYRKGGQDDKANRIETKQKKQNKAIIEAFKQNFDFCKTYFIYSNSFKKINEGHVSGIFLNDSTHIDTSIVLDQSNYFYCDYGTLYAETQVNQANPRVKVITSTPANQEVLVIKDPELQQLINPFPQHAKVKLNDFNNAAKNLNKQLKKFYYKSCLK